MTRTQLQEMTGQNQTANAALISAAPTILEALETLTEWMQAHTGPSDGTLTMLRDAVAAIDRARGNK